MLRLNLVSAELRHVINLKRIYSLISRSNRILISVAIMLAIILAVAAKSLENTFNKIMQASSRAENIAYNRKVNDVNAYINFIWGIQDEHIEWFSILKNISNLAPDNIALTSLRVDKNRGFKIKGSAPNREQLSSFKEALESSKYLSDIESPARFDQKNIDFEINGKISL